MQKVTVLCDFDRTITCRDTFNVFCEKYLADKNWQAIDEKFQKGEFSFTETISSIFNLLDAKLISEMTEFILNVSKIRDGFFEFVKYLDSINYEFAVVSSGFDFYIYPLLGKQISNNYKIYCNSIKIENNQIKPIITFYPEECPLCSNCKGLVANEFKKENKKVIGIGDGLSDKCLAKSSDFVFARDDLVKICKKENIKYKEFNDFWDIRNSILACDI